MAKRFGGNKRQWGGGGGEQYCRESLAKTWLQGGEPEGKEGVPTPWATGAARKMCSRSGNFTIKKYIATKKGKSRTWASKQRKVESIEKGEKILCHLQRVQSPMTIHDARKRRAKKGNCGEGESIDSEKKKKAASERS